MKIVKVCAVVIILAFAVISCEQGQTQAPIFYSISFETAPVPPRIPGSPTNMVLFHQKGTILGTAAPVLYVASGGLYWYAKNNDTTSPSHDEARWNLKEYRIPHPGGRVISLAVTNNGSEDRLYALCMSGTAVSTTLRYIENADLENTSPQWHKVDNGVTGYPYIQSIYADPDSGRLFAGARTASSATYAILYLDDTDDTLQLLKGGVPIFSGTAFNAGTHYLSTRGNGIYTVSEANLTAKNINDSTVTQFPNKPVNSETPRNNVMFMGMIKLEDKTIIAIERNNGALYKIEAGADGFEQMRYKLENNTGIIATGGYATGALALWENESGANKMLTAGIEGSLYTTVSSSYTHGYVEFDLNSNGSFNDASLRHGAGNMVSAPNNDQYTSSLGKHPVNHLFQTPFEIDDNMTFFASTQTAGLWSYRMRDRIPQWNAED